MRKTEINEKNCWQLIFTSLTLVNAVLIKSNNYCTTYYRPAFNNLDSVNIFKYKYIIDIVVWIDSNVMNKAKLTMHYSVFIN